ncbi:MAG TPA: C-type lectin domain-containing protein [Polyangiales bacterium]|nr:C-type lectin domain-containing protein [Polyangiales bacterium]
MSRLVGFALLALSCACDVYDARLSQPVTVQDASIAPPDAASAGEGDAAGPTHGEITASCTLASGTDVILCGLRCPELCNGRDDDCDGVTDEVEADRRCAAPHASAICQDGACLLTLCLDQMRDCNQRAEDGCEVEPDDPANCGACGHVCALPNASALCRDRQCRVDSCSKGFGDCDGDGLSCETELVSVEHCGACGRRCPDRPNAFASCERGECGMGECKPGWADCNGLAEDGCEAALDSLEHCGACGARCDKASCVGGVCTAADCRSQPGLADCDRDEASCEVDLRSDAQHCGSCERSCRFASNVTPHARALCKDATCQLACTRGWGDCDGRFDNGCERPLNTPTDCGGCGRVCALDYASVSCEDYTCSVQRCDPEHGDCDHDGRSCETRLDTLEHCGSCERSCQLPHAQQSCAGSADAHVCALTGCEANWGDCNGLAADGCERDLRSPASGGQGPCLPDADCSRASLGDHTYFVCPHERSWQAARSLCQSQVGSDLATIDNASEVELLRPMLTKRSWIGHNDLSIEGLWVWASNGVPFWRGESRGNAINGAYARWASGEPNGSGDCGAIYETGLLDDLSCTNTQPFVCEYTPDLCPDDPAKREPGQCGCNRVDRDTSGDGLADCDSQ